jgi:hypothetical protein
MNQAETKGRSVTAGGRKGGYLFLRRPHDRIRQRAYVEREYHAHRANLERSSRMGDIEP